MTQCALAKVLERVLYDRLYKNLIPTLHPSQYGGQKCLGVLNEISDLTQYVYENYDAKGGSVVMASLDFSADFDRVDHHHLVDELSRHGMDSSMKGVVASYLAGRSLCIKWRSSVSDLFPLNGG